MGRLGADEEVYLWMFGRNWVAVRLLSSRNLINDATQSKTDQKVAFC